MVDCRLFAWRVQVQIARVWHWFVQRAEMGGEAWLGPLWISWWRWEHYQKVLRMMAALCEEEPE